MRRDKILPMNEKERKFIKIYCLLKGIGNEQLKTKIIRKWIKEHQKDFDKIKDLME